MSSISKSCGTLKWAEIIQVILNHKAASFKSFPVRVGINFLNVSFVREFPPFWPQMATLFLA